MNSPRHRLSALLLSGLLLLIPNAPALAGSATWNLNPTNGDWNTATNWTPETVPNGPSDTATFGASDTTAVFLSATTEVDGIIFDSGANGFKIRVGNNLALTLSGVGISNNSGVTQNFVASGRAFSPAIQFINSATVGGSTRFTLNGPRTMSFFNNSTAGDGTFTFNATEEGLIPALFFYDSSSAGDGIFTFRANAINSGQCEFFGTSTAGNGFFTLSGGVGGGTFLGFLENSTADNATLLATAGINGGVGGGILFGDDSTGGSPRVILLGYGGSTGQSEGSLTIQHNPPGVTIGSLEGNGMVNLTDFSSPNLIIGSNNFSTTFSGVIHGGAGNSSRPSITKIGKGTLTLANLNDYTGGTTIAGGTLLVTNTTGTATGNGDVIANGGNLGGTGTIQGDTRIGNGTGRTSVLTPGVGGLGTLTIRKTLTFQLNGTYKWELNSDSTSADKVTAKGVEINNGALFSPVDLGSSVLSPGSVFTAIDNAAATPIAGTFSNLADGSRLTVGSNSFQVSYEGGDGNDLTLTVVP